MSIIVNGTTIPTDGDYLVINGVKIDKVNAVKNGVTTTVWEKVKENIILNQQTITSTSAPVINFGYTGNANSGVTSTVSYEEDYYWSTFGQLLGIWKNEDGTPGGVFNDIGYDHPSWDIEGAPCAKPWSLLTAIDEFDVTNYNYCEVEVCGRIETTPSSAISNFTYMDIGFGDMKSDINSSMANAVRLGWRWVTTHDSGLGTFDQSRGAVYIDKSTGAYADDWIATSQTEAGWATVQIPISTLSGIQKLHVSFQGSYENGGWCRIRKIRLHN